MENKLRCDILNEILKGDLTKDYTHERFGISEDVFLAEIGYLEKNKFVDGFSFYDGKNHLLSCAVLREMGEIYLISTIGNDFLLERMKLRFALLNEIGNGNYGVTADKFGITEDVFDSAIDFLVLEWYLSNVSYYDDKPHLMPYTTLTSKGELINSKYRV